MKKIILFIFGLLLFLFGIGCQSGKEHQPSYFMALCNSNYQHFGAVAMDSYGFYNCPQEKDVFSVRKEIGGKEHILLAGLDRSITMINPQEEKIYYLDGEKKICEYIRDSKKVIVLFEGTSDINYMRLAGDCLYYIYKFNLYSLNVETHSNELLCERVYSIDFYQDKIYAIVFPEDMKQSNSFKISTMNLDGSDYSELYSLNVPAKDINVSDYGIFYLSFGKTLYCIKNGMSEPVTKMSNMEQYALVNDQWIYYINSDMRGISRLNLEGSYPKTVVSGEKIHLFYILDDNLVYYDQEQFKSVKLKPFE